jgi:hypothetical protein
MPPKKKYDAEAVDAAKIGKSTNSRLAVSY